MLPPPPPDAEANVFRFPCIELKTRTAPFPLSTPIQSLAKSPTRASPSHQPETTNTTTAMPALETEMGSCLLLALTAGVLLLSPDVMHNNSNMKNQEDAAAGLISATLLLTHITLHALGPGLFALSRALHLTESYPRRRVPPVRYYWAGAYHLVGTMAQTSALYLWVLLALGRSGFLATLAGRVLLTTAGGPATNLRALQRALYIGAWIAAVFRGWDVYSRECAPEHVETYTTVVKEDPRIGGGGGGARTTTTTVPVFGYVSRAHWIQWFWMQRVGAWFTRDMVPDSLRTAEGLRLRKVPSCRTSVLDELDISKGSSVTSSLRWGFFGMLALETTLHILFLRHM